MTETSQFTQESGFFRRIVGRVLRPRNSAWSKSFGFVLILSALVCGVSTYMALTEVPPFGKDADTIIWLLNIDLIILVMLVAVIGRRIISLWSGHRRGLSGTRLHMKLAFIFSLMAALPAIIMTIFSAFFLHFGVETWFSDRIRTAVNESEAVAEAYLAEHQQVIKADTLAMANDLDRQASLLLANKDGFDRLIKTQLLLRNLSEAVIMQADGQILAEAGMTFTLAFESLPISAMEQADSGEVVVMTGGNDDRVRALVKLGNFYNSYLYVGRMVDSTVLRHLNDTRQAVAAYEQLDSQYKDLQVKITLTFVVVAVILLLAAMWAGLMFARDLVSPISALVTAADRVRAGDLTARVREFNRHDEFDLVTLAFNRMTSQLEEQQNALVATNRQLDERRLFTESVLANVSSGVISTDGKGDITIANESAARMLGLTPGDLHSRNITALMPELAPYLAYAYEKPDKILQAEIPFSRRDEARRIFLLRIAAEDKTGKARHAVITFDDITELQSAQRKAAWADVARRIAHEIKNPLTPIQLSAERLKRKYMKQIQDDPETFAQCTDTIIHHVGDIGRMVNEFSAFARMPLPVFKSEDVGQHMRELLTLQQEAHPALRFDLVTPQSGLRAEIDAQQFRQAFTNIIQNAIDSLQGFQAENPDFAGHIKISAAPAGSEGTIAIAVSDNGPGFPRDIDPAQLTEPYVTRRAKGTGLGLAIVKKIMEDHKGRLILGAPEWLRVRAGAEILPGATVVMILPVNQADTTPVKNAEAA